MVAMSSSSECGLVVVADPRVADVDERGELPERQPGLGRHRAGADEHEPPAFGRGLGAERAQAEPAATHDRQHALDRAGHRVDGELEGVLDHAEGPSMRSAFAPPGGTFGQTLASRSMRMSSTTGPRWSLAFASDAKRSRRRSTRIPSTPYAS